MSRQNRVTPFGDIVALPGRGMLTGNRGILHDERQQIVRSSQVRRWIACSLSYRGRRREIMQPHTWTELFFLDEVTALSAGHRPCAECRRADYNRYAAAWQRAHGERPLADVMDALAHSDRRLRGGQKRTYRTSIDDLPDGAFIALDHEPWLIWRSALHRWSDGGYTDRRSRFLHAVVEVLTPRAIVATIAAGYEPLVHGRER